MRMAASGRDDVLHDTRVLAHGWTGTRTRQLGDPLNGERGGPRRSGAWPARQLEQEHTARERMLRLSNMMDDDAWA